jgi:hypothetical protein
LPGKWTLPVQGFNAGVIGSFTIYWQKDQRTGEKLMAFYPNTDRHNFIRLAPRAARASFYADP